MSMEKEVSDSPERGRMPSSQVFLQRGVWMTEASFLPAFFVHAAILGLAVSFINNSGYLDNNSKTEMVAVPPLRKHISHLTKVDGGCCSLLKDEISAGSRCFSGFVKHCQGSKQ
eukprot:TRINITY_DN3343_c1_g1_i11.p1 TRINITY_DN3343_c1_g1~~TRINITY_DN3343_c1_g1_i11.p1  ORF type:complete len:114 (-),score=7.06 TRINITY_DN3343_c1_g1_i11:253-594(-)